MNAINGADRGKASDLLDDMQRKDIFTERGMRMVTEKLGELALCCLCIRNHRYVAGAGKCQVDDVKGRWREMVEDTREDFLEVLREEGLREEEVRGGAEEMRMERAPSPVQGRRERPLSPVQPRRERARSPVQMRRDRGVSPPPPPPRQRSRPEPREEQIQVQVEVPRPQQVRPQQVRAQREVVGRRQRVAPAQVQPQVRQLQEALHVARRPAVAPIQNSIAPRLRPRQRRALPVDCYACMEDITTPDEAQWCRQCGQNICHGCWLHWYRMRSLEGRPLTCPFW